MKYLMLELRSYMLDINDDLYEMFQEIPYKDEFKQTNDFFGKTKEEIKKEIDYRMRIAYSLTLTKNDKPMETYILYVENRPVCIGGIRLRLNDYWKEHGGNIWYKTRPSERRKGYATIFVKMLCERAKSFGLKEILAQCKVNNYGSNRVLQNNGFQVRPNEFKPYHEHTNFYRKEL